MRSQRSQIYIILLRALIFLGNGCLVFMVLGLAVAYLQGRPNPWTVFFMVSYFGGQGFLALFPISRIHKSCIATFLLVIVTSPLSILCFYINISGLLRVGFSLNSIVFGFFLLMSSFVPVLLLLEYRRYKRLNYKAR